MILQQRLSIVTLGVRDIPESVDFYTRILGWRRDMESEDFVLFNLGGYCLGLYPIDRLAEDIGEDVVSPNKRGYNGFTLAYNARSKGRVDEIFAKLANENVTILKSPREVFWGGYSGYFADADGHPWEVAHNPYWRVEEDGRMVRL